MVGNIDGGKSLPDFLNSSARKRTVEVNKRRLGQRLAGGAIQQQLLHYCC